MADHHEVDPKKGLENRKIDPRLRLLANCDFEVCCKRAQSDSALIISEAARLTSEVPVRKMEGGLTKKYREKRKKDALNKPIDTAVASVFVSFADDADFAVTKSKNRKTPVRSKMETADLALSEIAALADRPEVVSIEIGDRVRVPPIILSQGPDEAARPTLTVRKITSESRIHHYGEQVLVGIIDVGGIDFAHEDFLNDDGTTRIERIWDMGGDHRSPPGQFEYGAEFKQSHLNDAIATAKNIGVSPHAIEPQVHRQIGSHATHVTSIAAGNRGVSRESPIACVMLDLAPEDGERRKSFYDSVRVAHAIDYILQVARDLGKSADSAPLPVAINISLGTNGHAHDGSSAISRWVDNALSVPGRVVCVAAGNSGQEAPTYPGDLGYIMGRIHSSGQIVARGLTNTMEWTVVGDGIADMSENEMEIWYEPQDRFSVVVESPGPDSVKIGPVKPGEFIENKQLPDGTFISIYNEFYRPANGCNSISIYLTPFLKEPMMGVKAGEWRVSLTGEDVRDGRYHAWVERDDPHTHIRRHGISYASYPSFFSAKSNVDSNSVSSLACGERIVSVGNYDTDLRAVNISSSQGPTRTGRNKPEVMAPGTNIVAANGFAGKDKAWVGMTGTSMASPYVTGAAALMLNAEPTLTSTQILGIMRRTARPVENSDFNWKDDNGFGQIDVEACLKEARSVNQRSEIK